MSWWGKVFGGTFGYMFGGSIGALVGAVLGHNFDGGLRRSGSQSSPLSGFSDRERMQTVFFTATFSVMGHLAKADGRVTPDEIDLATAIMQRMGLGHDQRQAARRLFSEGKSPGFPLDDVLDQLRRECRRRHSLLRVFLEVQMQAAYADGELHPDERRLLRRISLRLGFEQREFDAIESMVNAQARVRHGPNRDIRQMGLHDAYAVLGVHASADDHAVKRAYQRLMSQHHPDKLVSKGLPEEMIRVATEKTQEIKAAYERVKTERTP